MNENEIVSIIMPAYNAEATIRSSIDSVIGQTFSDFKLYIINDASTDRTEKIVKEYEDSRIIYIKNEYNIGVAESRNKGIEICNGKYIAFIDSDDLWESNKLELQCAYLNSGMDIVCSNYVTFSENPMCVKSKRVSPQYITYNDMLKSNFIGNLTGVYNSSKLGKVYQKKVGHEDYVMWLELINRTNYCYCIQDYLAKYRESNKSLSGNKFRAILWQWMVYRKELGMGLINAIYYFSNYIYNGVLKRNN
ncbi:glycosyltransferase family 2 protein [Escherichia albertii]|uniref:Predicted glycosyltransferase, group II family n=1 Tax=Escherichia albertii TaxID=208962 RepID=A0A5A4U686_ESCAL|nr:glycosyltransferase family 2 protein [Escherichia albertii]MCZ8630996.1 glycosyltransferase family 2 protein [Escherichia albertii]MCZ8635836.1 glycosyltransferase family 2 protein [Escherichia albertii]MCZ8672882.1 glycosyltransferase family 2 protein [Escherichia albertii]BBM62616.1 predicted glycosyltransferase, group II family [Escherichia albertii]